MKDRDSATQATRAALRSAAIYLVVAGVWIVASDAAVELLPPASQSFAQSVKGLLFVLVTGLALFWSVRASVGQVLRSRRELQRQAERREELERQLAHAHRLEAIGRLAGGIAHDFNNLLTVINGYADLTLKRVEPDTPLQGELTQIAAAGRRAAALTRQLLAFGRQQVLRPAVLAPGEVLESLGRLLGRLIGEDVRLQFDVAEDAGRVRVDRGQLEQVLMNLVINARDALRGGGTITLGVRSVEVREGQTGPTAELPAGPWVELRVEDDGEGILPDLLPRIFEPFFTTKQRNEGTGLGLAMVYGIIKQSGGEVRVESTVGRGTAFRIYLPRVEAEAAPTAHFGDDVSTPRGSERVLLLEDEEAVREFLRAALVEHGYRVDVAGDADSALCRADQLGPALDLVVTDVVLPGMSGPDFVARLRERFPHVPVLYLSGYVDESLATRVAADPAADFLSKPVTAGDLAARVRAILDARLT